jgi:hypothetical protein
VLKDYSSDSGTGVTFNVEAKSRICYADVRSAGNMKTARAMLVFTQHVNRASVRGNII